MTDYNKLSKWAAKHNMQYKVECENESTYLWMADACDGYLGAECVCINEGIPTWLGYRFRLQKNIDFLEKFLKLGEYEDTNGEWLGHKDPEPLFILPYYYRYEHGSWRGTGGVFYWLDKEPSDAVMDEMASAGCELLKSSPQYAPEIVSHVVFVPNGTPFLYHNELFGTTWVGRETIAS